MILADLKIGTRKSPLALWQANWVKGEIEKKHSIAVELVPIATQGDKILDVALAKVGGKGLFVKELETALLEGEVDLAVHSMKDVPTDLPDGLFLSTICEREDARDAYIARTGVPFLDLPQGAVIGTSSLRRQTQLLARRPDLKIVTLRGNIGTRMRKMDEEMMDGIILAAAGLIRMEEAARITEYLSSDLSLPAVAQGALGLEARVDDVRVLSYLEFLNHEPTRVCVEAERSFLARLEGGCQVPIAAHATMDGGKVTLTGLVGALDGSKIFRETVTFPPCDRIAKGAELADRLLAQGAGEILREAYGR
ncbi:MAG: hydroxymethylbilane synthase [Nitrospinae bacterium]|nr:hydroxymethylbilane synthase [Nitrospinota bacterium]